MKTETAEYTPATEHVGDELTTTYDVHYRNVDTKWKWYRWFDAPTSDRQKCSDWIARYNRPTNICGLVHIPMTKGLRTEFRIVESKRTIIDVSERQD